MGLDNGIRIVTDNENLIVGIPFYVKLFGKRVKWESHDRFERYIDVAYWRKCHGLRHEVISYLNDLEQKGNEELIRLTKDDVGKIQKIIFTMLIGNPFQVASRFRTYFYSNFYVYTSNIRYLINLFWVKRIMSKNQDIEVFFIDSY